MAFSGDHVRVSGSQTDERIATSAWPSLVPASQHARMRPPPISAAVALCTKPVPPSAVTDLVKNGSLDDALIDGGGAKPAARMYGGRRTSMIVNATKIASRESAANDRELPRRVESRLTGGSLADRAC